MLRPCFGPHTPSDTGNPLAPFAIPLLLPRIVPQNLCVELKAESDTLSRRQREKELMLRQYRVAETALREARDGLPNLKFQVGRSRMSGVSNVVLDGVVYQDAQGAVTTCLTLRHSADTLPAPQAPRCAVTHNLARTLPPAG